MPRKKQPGKKKFKNTQFGKRTIASSRKPASQRKEGVDRLGNSSVLTQTSDIPGPRGRTDVSVNPTIRRVGGRLVKLSPREAAIVAETSGDFVRVRGGKTPEAIERARRRGDKKSEAFSKRLGKRSDRATRAEKIKKVERKLKGR